MRYTDRRRRGNSRRVVGTLLVAGLLGSACGSGSSDDVTSTSPTGDDRATTTVNASRSVASPDQSVPEDVPVDSGDVTVVDSKADAESTTTASSSPTSTAPTVTSSTISGSPTITAPTGSTTSTSPITTSTTSRVSTTTTSQATSTTSATTTTTTAPTTVPSSVPARIDLPDQVASTEGIATDPNSGRVFIGELNNGNVWVGSLAPDSFTLFSSGAAAGRSTALGLAADAHRRRLYVVSPANNRVDVLNLDNGGLISSVTIPVGAGSLINDAAVAPDGTVYITDTGRPSIYRIASGSSSAELWVDYSNTDAVPTASRTQHGNGVVANDEHVLVAYMVGGELLRFDRSSGVVSRVSVSGAPSAGRDGLVMCGNRLYGVDIASLAGGQESVWITNLANDWSSGTSVGSIRSDTFSSASTAAMVDGSLVVVNAQFGVAPQERPFWLSIESTDC